jgi:hypothetical protein
MKFLLLLSSILVPMGFSLGADDIKDDRQRDPWYGFGDGSWVIRAESLAENGTMKTRREKQTRTPGKGIGGIWLNVRNEGNTPGVFDGPESSQTHIPGYDPARDSNAKLVDTTRRELTIQDKKYTCDVKKYALNRRGGEVTVVYWNCKDVRIPYREAGLAPASFALGPDVVRLEVDFQGKGRTEKTTLTVVHLREERQIGKHKLICVREEGQIEFSDGKNKGKGKITTILSDEVPGREVELIAEVKTDERTFTRKVTIESFEVVKEK